MDPQDNPQTPPSDLTPPAPESTPPESSPDSPPDDPLAALDLGIAEATPTDEPAADPLGEHAKSEAPADPAAPVDPAAPPAETPPVDEAVTLGLKGRTAERFNELLSQTKELAPVREALTAAGLKVEDVPRIVQHAKVAEEMVSMVQSTGASSEQYGSALEYLRMVNAASKGDRQAAEAAYGVMEKELQALATMLGKEVPGVHDPLKGHSDLLQAVENGDVTRQYALEIAATRAAGRLSEHHQQQTSQQAQQQQMAAQASQQIATLDQQWRAADPHYAARRPALSQMVTQIQRTLPPAQWAEATRNAYAAIAAIPVAIPAPPAAKPAVSGVPVRPTGARQNLAPQTDDPYEALNQGIAAAMG